MRDETERRRRDKIAILPMRRSLYTYFLREVRKRNGRHVEIQAHLPIRKYLKSYLLIKLRKEWIENKYRNQSTYLRKYESILTH